MAQTRPVQPSPTPPAQQPNFQPAHQQSAELGNGWQHQKKKGKSDDEIMKIGMIAIGLVVVVVLGLAGLYIVQRAMSGNRSIASESSSLTTTADSNKVKPTAKPAATSQADSAGTSRPAGGDMKLADLIETIEPSVVRLDVQSSEGESVGSGVFVGNGKIVTNFHVVQGAHRVLVRSSDGKEVVSTGFYYADPLKDLAVIDIDSAAISVVPIKIASSLPRKGEQVAAFGSPLGFSFSATSGVVSSIRDGAEIQEVFKTMVGIDIYLMLGYSTKTNWIQMTAAISGGNSGGPLVDMRGHLIGINTWTNPQGQNLNFASTKDEVQTVLDKSEGIAKRGFSSLPTQKIQIEFKPTPGNRGGVASNGNNHGRPSPSQRGPGSSVAGMPNGQTGGGEITVRVVGSEETAERAAEARARLARKRIEKEGIQTIVASTGEQFVESRESQVAREFQTDGGLVTDIDISQDESLLVAVTDNGTVWAFDARKGSLLYKIACQYKLIRCVDLVESPLRVVTYSDNRSNHDNIDFRNWKTGEVDTSLQNSDGKTANVLAISKDGRSIFAADQDYASDFFRVDVMTGKPAELKFPTIVSGRKVQSAAFSSDDKHLMVGYQNGMLTVFNFIGSKLTDVAGGQVHDSKIVGIEPSKLELKFASASLDGLVKITNHSTKRWRKDVYGTQDFEALGLAWSGDETLLAVSRANNTIEVFDVATKELVDTIPTKSICGKIRFFGGSRFLVAGCVDGKIRFYALK